MPAHYLFDLQRTIARFLLDGIEHLSIKPERAAKISRFVLSTFPDNAPDDVVLQKLPELKNYFPELGPVVQHFLHQHELGGVH